MIRISALNSADFVTIENALKELDPTEEFLSYFETVEQCETNTLNEVKVVLKNTTLFRKDLNNNKYVIGIPDSLIIDCFETVETYETVGSRRVAQNNVIIKCHMSTNEVKFVLVLSGFNSNRIKVAHLVDVCSCPCHTSNKNQNDDDVDGETVIDKVINND